MAGNIGANVIAAALDAFSFTLLIPFLNALFGEQQLISNSGWIGRLQTYVVGSFLNPADKLGSVEAMIIAIVAIVAVKNVFVWAAGQLGASLQELVTRDLRDRVFAHMQRLHLNLISVTNDDAATLAEDALS